MAPKALESCSNPEMTWQVFESAVKKKKFFLVLGLGFFVSDIISRVVLGLFGPLHLAIGPDC